MRIKILPILIALMMLGTAGLFGYAHNNPNGPLGALDFQIVPLSNSPNGGGPLYASGGFGNLSGSNIGKLTYTVEPVQGTYQYNGRPYIASSITSDGTSSNFDLLVNGNITIYEFAVSDSSYVKFTTTFYTNITINGQFIDYYSESYTYNDASFISGTVTQPFSLQIVPTTSITGAYNNIMTFSIHSVTTANPTGGWGLFASGSFHT